jgi:CBS domain-containing protein
MQAKDVMTMKVISVPVHGTVPMAAQLMLEKRISGLPVVDATEKLVGVVTEGDFLRRSEIGRYCCKSHFAQVIKNSAGCRRVFGVKM